MFNLFKKGAVNKKIPSDYKHLLLQEEYERMLGYVFSYFNEKGEEVIKLGDGFLTVKDDTGKEMKYGFDNLVRMVAAADKDDWEQVVYSHFNKVNFSDAPYSFYFKDYGHARQYLKVLIKDEGILKTEYGADLVARKDFPGTCTVLVFDYDNQFRFLKKEDIKEWHKTEEELFHEALDNIAGEEVQIHSIKHDEGFEVFSFFSGDFSAAKMIDPEKNAEFSIGRFGAVIAIPTKGAAFCSPISDRNVMQILEMLAPVITGFFEKDPGSITASFFWYYKGVIREFPTRPTADGYVTVSLPKELEELFKSPTP
ncbi:MAG: hypothetical protein SFU87_02370 [Chitinophagaceae bacterium]|nr:hypothetical protein [Chitinophagaceae bacterium]